MFPTPGNQGESRDIQVHPGGLAERLSRGRVTTVLTSPHVKAPASGEAKTMYKGEQVTTAPELKKSTVAVTARGLRWRRSWSAAGTICGRLLGSWLLVSAISFVIVFGMGQDPAAQALGKEASQGQLSSFRQEYGLDRPFALQYLHWLWSAVHGDLGHDYTSGVPVLGAVLTPMFYTIMLAGIAILLSFPFALVPAVFSGMRRSSSSDRLMLAGSMFVVAIPEFVVAVGLVFVFAVWIPVLPVNSTALTLTPSPKQYVQSLALPCATLVIVLSASLFRIARAAVAQVADAKYVEAARLRGLSSSVVVGRYVVRNSLPSMVNAVALSVVWLLGGVVVVEQVFGYPGLGMALIQSVSAGNPFRVQAIVVLMGGLFLLVGALADGLVAYLNRHEDRSI